MNRIILGTAQLGMQYGINNQKGRLENNEVFQILDTAYNNGIRILDTADAYGNALSLIGDYHQHHHKFYVINKFASADSSFEDRVKRNLDTLQINSIYGYLFHNYKESIDENFVGQLTELKKKGYIERIGVSIYTNEELEALLDREEIDLIQLPYNLFDNENIRGDLIRKAKNKNKIIHVRSVFLQGLFFMKKEHLPIKLKILSKYLASANKVAKENFITMSELALGYVFENSNIDGIIIGVDNVEHLQMNLDTLKAIKKKKFNYQEKINQLIKVKEKELLNPSNWK